MVIGEHSQYPGNLLHERLITLSKKSVSISFHAHILPILFAFFSYNAQGQETPMEYSEGVVASSCIQAPPRTFLLIRNNDAICAIKFTETLRSNDKSVPNTFHSGEESFRSRYQWYLGEKIKSNWELHPPKSSGESEVSRGKLYGIGRLAFGGGDIKIQCGSIKVKWSAPAHVYFYQGATAANEGNEIALTTWESFEDIDPNDQSLQWLQFNKSRQITPIK